MDLLLARFVPGPGVALVAGTVGLLVGLAGAVAAVGAHRRWGLPVPDTRKIFHFVVFSSAVPVQAAWGTPGTVAFGSVVAAGVLASVVRGAGDPLFEALARPSDRPRRGLFVVAPLVATAAGGVLSNLLAPTWAGVGYLLAGWGDAVGEPVGVRWGRRRYRVPSLAGVRAERSLEGSAAVLVAGVLACWLALALAGVPAGRGLAVGAACGAAGTVVEAVSHHGLDNLTLQVTGTAVAAWLLGG